MKNNTNDLILVTGGTGKTGRRVVQRLSSAGLPVRIGSRSGDPAFDWNDKTTWAGAVENVTAAYISYFPDIAAPGGPEAIDSFSRFAVQHGVSRLVLLSGRGEVEAERAEALVKEAGAEWTILRSSWFNQNFDESYFAEPIENGALALPAGDVATPFIDVEDIADVAFVALTEDGHAGQVYDLTGPRGLTFTEAVAEIADATGRPASFVQITMDDFEAGMAAEGAPGDVISILGHLFTEVLVESNSGLGDGVQRALGRQPRDFRDFARRAAAAGAWNKDRVLTS